MFSMRPYEWDDFNHRQRLCRPTYEYEYADDDDDEDEEEA